MKQLFARTLVAALVVGAAAMASAQTTVNVQHPGMDGAQMHQPGGWHQPDPAKMQALFDKRMERFKTLLQLTPTQEGAWTTFAAAIKPPSTLPAHPDRAEIEKLTTPERLEKLHAMRVQRSARMDQIENATKTFYAALNPAQRKVFDMETLKLHDQRQMMQWRHNPRHGEDHHG